MNFKVIIIDDVHQILKDELNNIGIGVDTITKIDYNSLFDIINNYDGIILRSKVTLDKPIIDKAKNLKFIARVGAGMENIDVEYALSNKIACINSPEGNRDAVGEHTLGLLLSLMKNINISNDEIKNNIWNREKNKGFEISDKTIGIIGYGNMGSAFAERLSGFKANVIAYDKYKKGYGNNLVKETNLDEIFEHADILSLHVPLTEETKYMVNSSFLHNFKKNIYLINTSRGNVIKTSDLIKGLKSGKLIGAGLDVIEYEEQTFDNIFFNDEFKLLLENKNVIITPHIAGITYESSIKHAKVIFEKINIVLNNKC